jgi:esterase/lipase superfamily enzyme
MAQRIVHFATNRIWDGKAGFGAVCCDPLGRLLAGKVPCQGSADPAVEGKCGEAVVAAPDDPDTGLVDSLTGWLDLAHAEARLPLLYVHGFNFSFAEALARTASLCDWLEAEPGAPRLAPFAFTWPSNGMGSLDGYLDDQKDAGRSGLALARLIAAIAVMRPKTAPVYLAHSMGARATRHAMEAILPMLHGLPKPVFRQAVIMAGDDVADVLDNPRLDAAPGSTAGALRPIAELARHVTIGVNRDDGVVWLVSGSVNRGDRLGTAGPSRPADLPANVRVVDYSLVVAGKEVKPVPQTEVEPNWIGHQYFRNDPRTRVDLVKLLAADGPPDKVPGRRKAQPDGTFGKSEIEGRLYVEP